MSTQQSKLLNCLNHKVQKLEKKVKCLSFKCKESGPRGKTGPQGPTGNDRPTGPLGPTVESKRLYVGSKWTGPIPFFNGYILETIPNYTRGILYYENQLTSSGISYMNSGATGAPIGENEVPFLVTIDKNSGVYEITGIVNVFLDFEAPNTNAPVSGIFFFSSIQTEFNSQLKTEIPFSLNAINGAYSTHLPFKILVDSATFPDGITEAQMSLYINFNTPSLDVRVSSWTMTVKKI